MANLGGQCVKLCEGLEGKPRINTPTTHTGPSKAPASGLPYYSPDTIAPQVTSTTTTSIGIDSDAKFNKPIPYVFRVPAPAKCCEARHAKCPPFYLQLDHTIAVLWFLFEYKTNQRPIKRELGIGQLQWALYFIRGIKSPSDGTYSPDVEMAIRTIEDALLDCYADMSGVVMRFPPPQGRPCSRCDLVRSIPRGPCNICSALSLGVGVKPRKSGMKIPGVEHSTRPTTVQTSYNFTQLGSTIKPMDPAIILAINRLRNIAAKFDKPNSKTKLEAKEATGKDIKHKQSCGELYSLLNNWRQDQIHRVEKELRRLKSLDTYIGNEMEVTEISAASSEWPSRGFNLQPITNSTARPGR